jgi:hypothetical protein
MNPNIKLSLNVRVGDDDCGGRLFGTNGNGRFADAIFGAMPDFRVEALLDINPMLLSVEE